MGEKYTSLISGKSLSQRSLKNQNLLDLGVAYDSSKNAWMTKNIFLNWLMRLNLYMKNKNRKICLLVDNASSHDIKETFTNIDLVYLPPNTTSVLQPCDQGIIKALKDKFNYYMTMTVIFEKLENSSSQSDLYKSINILDAISVLKLAWDDVSDKTIINCFKKAFVSKTIEEIKIINERSKTMETEEEIQTIIYDECCDVSVEESDDDELTDLTARDLSEIDEAFEILIRFSKKNMPTRILDIYRFKIDLFREYNKKNKRQPKISDFFTKK